MRHDSSYLRDALRAIQELEEFVASTTEQQFLSDKFRQSYAFHRLVILGEAAVQLAKPYQQTYPSVPWSRLIALRNRLVHAYFDLDQPLLWNTLNSRLDELRAQLKLILESEFPGQSY